MQIITKTIFIDFRNCPKNVWLKLHKPELLEKFELSDFEKQLIEQGNEVENHARKLFPNGLEVLSRGEEAGKETEKHMKLKTSAIFQATFIVDGFMARNDVLAYDKKNDCWDLYEIKGTNSLKETGDERNHIDDLTFQAVVLGRANIKVGKTYLIHLNKEYVRSGELDYKNLFTTEDLTETVRNKMEEIGNLMDGAREYLNKENEPATGCDCNYRGRSRHCATFAYSHPEVPEYSVHDLSRIGSSKKKLQFFVENEIFSLENIPNDYELSEIQTNQLIAHKTQKPSINLEEIREQINSLNFPLYFLDYETYAPAIPYFQNYSPYNRIPFQFSLHILREPNEKPEHVEFLHPNRSDPSELVAELLEKYIKSDGTVIVWNKTFEKTMNTDIGKRVPKYREIMERINTQMYDLMDIFSKQHFIHPNFHGSASIKKVLPVLVPELQYKDLVIHEGGQASEQWWKMVDPKTSKEEYNEIFKNLKIYCAMDTYAMYAIWKFLKDL